MLYNYINIHSEDSHTEKIGYPEVNRFSPCSLSFDGYLGVYPHDRQTAPWPQSSRCQERRHRKTARERRVMLTTDE